MSRKCLSHGLGRCSCCRFLPSHGNFHLAAVAGQHLQSPRHIPFFSSASLQMLNPARPFAPHHPLLTGSRTKASVPFHRLQMKLSRARATNQLFNARIPQNSQRFRAAQRDSLFTLSLSLLLSSLPTQPLRRKLQSLAEGKS